MQTKLRFKPTRKNSPTEEELTELGSKYLMFISVRVTIL